MMQPGGGLLSTSSWGISLDWTEEEQRTLENYMMRFPPDRMDPLQRYVRIAAALPRKGVRDVALRMRWTAMQAQLKRRTGLDPRGAPGMPPLPGSKAMMPMAAPMMPMPPQFMPPAGANPVMIDDHNTIDGPITHLLDANLAILNHFRANMAAFKVHENTQLLVQFRDNIVQILQAMEAMGGVMAEMPALPVRMNMELANSFLPSRPAGVLTYEGMMMPPPPQPALNAPGMVPINGPGFTPGTAAGLGHHPSGKSAPSMGTAAAGGGGGTGVPPPPPGSGPGGGGVGPGQMAPPPISQQAMGQPPLPSNGKGMMQPNYVAAAATGAIRPPMPPRPHMPPPPTAAAGAVAGPPPHMSLPVVAATPPVEAVVPENSALPQQQHQTVPVVQAAPPPQAGVPAN